MSHRYRPAARRSVRAHTRIRRLVSLFVLPVLAACSSPDVEIDTAEIRVIHLSPDAGPIDVWVREPEGRIVEGLEFASTSDWTPVEVQANRLEIVPAGGGIDDGLLTIEGAELQPDASHTVVVYGPMDAAEQRVLVDDRSPIEAGRVRIRAVHAAPDAGLVDLLDLTDPDTPDLLFGGLLLGDASQAAEVAAGPLLLGVDLGGDGEIDLELEVTGLDEGRMVNLLLAEDTTGALLLVVQHDDGTTDVVGGNGVIEPGDGQMALRMIHLAPDLGPVDLWADDTGPLHGGLAFGEATGFTTTEAEITVLTITREGEQIEDGILFWGAAGLQAEGIYNVVIAGTEADPHVTVAQEDFDDVEAGRARIRIFHTAAAFEQTDLWIRRSGEAPILIMENLLLGTYGHYLEVREGVWGLGLDASGDGLLEVLLPPFTLVAGTVVNVYPVTESDGAPFLLLQDAAGRLDRLDGERPDPPADPEALAE